MFNLNDELVEVLIEPMNVRIIAQPNAYTVYVGMWMGPYLPKYEKYLAWKNWIWTL